MWRCTSIHCVSNPCPGHKQLSTFPSHALLPCVLRLFYPGIFQRTRAPLPKQRQPRTWCFVSRLRIARVFFGRRSSGMYFCTQPATIPTYCSETDSLVSEQSKGNGPVTKRAPQRATTLGTTVCSAARHNFGYTRLRIPPQPSATQCAPQPPPQLRSHGSSVHPATTLGHTVRSNSRKWNQEQGSQVKVTKLCQAETVWNY